MRRVEFVDDVFPAWKYTDGNTRYSDEPPPHKGIKNMSLAERYGAIGQ